jgi:hypothetical protein
MAPDGAIRMHHGAAPGAATQPATIRSALPILDDATRSPNPDVCPFFRRQVDGVLFIPLGSPDEENVCAAIGVPKPQSARQQELVCLKAAHADCPRYLRGALAYPEPPRPRRQTAVPRATLAALLVLVLSAGISFGFVVQRGGLELPVVAASASSTAVAVVGSSTSSPSSQPASAAPSVVASSSPSPTPSPSPTSSPSPTPTPSPTPSPTPKATPKPTKKPTSDRYKLLKACPNTADCWIYTVRSGDNLSSIANYFGHPLRTIYAWNPKYPGTALRVGAQIRMPPPTR